MNDDSSVHFAFLHPSKTTLVQIPCCLCGTLILPNAANQCPSCLSQSFNLQSILQRGPGNAEQVTIHQCRKCRRFQKSETRYEACDMESPELLALCLKQIPALQTVSGNNHTLYSKIQLVDANFIWTEPHSMRLKLHLTVRTTVQGVILQQRVQTWLKIQWSQCSDCNREFTHRTWQAIVQVRQKRTYDTSTNTLALLEMALAKNRLLRQDVLQIDSVSLGFDFYFLSYRKAQLFAAGLQRILPCRLQTTRKMVSEDNHNNTANVKYTLLLELVPLCRHDLIVIDKTVTGGGKAGPLSGRLALVQRLGAGAIHCLDASPSHTLKRQHETGELTVEPISQEAYYKHEKAYHVLQSYKQLAKFIVLDVELWNQDEERKRRDDIGGVPLDIIDETASVNTAPSRATAIHNYKRFALADVQVVRADGAGDEILTTVSHLGLLLQPGDVVLGYDLAQSTVIQQDELLTRSLHSNVVVPDVVLIKKVKGAAATFMDDDLDDVATVKTAKSSRNQAVDPASGAKRRVSKAKERRRRRDQGKRTVELEQSAMRMGLLGEVPAHLQDFDDEDEDEDNDADWVEDLAELERDLAGIDMMGGTVDGDDAVEDLAEDPAATTTLSDGNESQLPFAE